MSTLANDTALADVDRQWSLRPDRLVLVTLMLLCAVERRT